MDFLFPGQFCLFRPIKSQFVFPAAINPPHPDIPNVPPPKVGAEGVCCAPCVSEPDRLSIGGGGRLRWGVTAVPLCLGTKTSRRPFTFKFPKISVHRADNKVSGAAIFRVFRV